MRFRYGTLGLCIKSMHGSRGGGGGRGSGPPPPMKNHKDIGFLSNTGPDPLKNHKACSQCWAIIGLPAKHHFNGVLLACQ